MNDRQEADTATAIERIVTMCSDGAQHDEIAEQAQYAIDVLLSGHHEANKARYARRSRADGTADPA